MLDIEVESAFGKGILNMRHNLFLNAGFVVSNVLTHELPQLLRPLLPCLVSSRRHIIIICGEACLHVRTVVQCVIVLTEVRRDIIG